MARHATSEVPDFRLAVLCCVPGRVANIIRASLVEDTVLSPEVREVMCSRCVCCWRSGAGVINISYVCCVCRPAICSRELRLT